MQVNSYWLVFTSGDYWWRHFLKKGFAHCYLLTADDYNWLRINPTIKRLEVAILNYERHVDVPALLANDNTIIKIEVLPDLMKAYMVPPYCFVSCARTLALIIGLRFCIFTPYGLYKKLLRVYNAKQLPKYIKSLLFYSKGETDG